MSITRNTILYIFCLLLLAQCNDKQAESTEIDTRLKFQLPLVVASISKHPNSYIGEWSYSFMFYSSELFINEDGTFRFHGQGCTGHCYSEGVWTKYGTDILLTSAEKYSTNRPFAITEVNRKNKYPKPKQKRTKDKITFTYDPSFPDAAYSSRVGWSDTANVYFNNRQLRLEGDTLFLIEGNGLKTGAKYLLAKNNY